MAPHAISYLWSFGTKPLSLDSNKLWYDVQHEENMICAQFGKDLFNISKVTGRKKVAQFFWQLFSFIARVQVPYFCSVVGEAWRRWAVMTCGAASTSDDIVSRELDKLYDLAAQRSAAEGICWRAKQMFRVRYLLPWAMLKSSVITTHLILRIPSVKRSIHCVSKNAPTLKRYSSKL